MNEWQKRWHCDKTGRWTHRLIPDLQAWKGRQHGEVDFYLTQFLTNLGYFHDLLKELQKVATKQCLHCPDVNDTVEHAFFGCVCYSKGHPPYQIWKPEKLVPKMLRSPENWDKVAEYVRATFIAENGGGLSIVEIPN